MGEQLDLTLLVERIGRSSLSMVIVGHVAGLERLRARLVTAMVSLETHRSVELPPLPCARNSRCTGGAPRRRKAEPPNSPPVGSVGGPTFGPAGMHLAQSAIPPEGRGPRAEAIAVDTSTVQGSLKPSTPNGATPETKRAALVRGAWE